MDDKRVRGIAVRLVALRTELKILGMHKSYAACVIPTTIIGEELTEKLNEK